MSKLSYPWAIEREYYAHLRKVVNALKIITKMRHDSESEDEIEELMLMYASLHQTEQAIAKAVTVSRLLKEYTKEELLNLIEMSMKDQFVPTLSMRVNIFEEDPKLKQLLAEWVSENTKLINSIPTQYFDKLQTIVSQGITEGTTTSDIATQIQDLYAMTENRAKLIAVDQVGKLNGQITKARQVSVGVRFYRWSTARDERVRESHAMREGHLYAWDSANYGASYNGETARATPPDGIPGHAIRCRCIAQPVLEQLEAIENV